MVCHNFPVFFKSHKDMKDKKTLSQVERLLSANQDPVLDHGTKKPILLKNC
jgi:hypothetical protein